MIRLRPLFLLALLAPGAPLLTGCDGQQAGTCVSDAEFNIEDLTPEGTALGATAAPGSCVTVDYVGRRADGSGTFDEGTGLNLLVTTGRGFITGFVIGVSNQQVGQTRRVTVPPNFGYGVSELDARDGVADETGEAFVGIPSCSVLEFDITLVRVNSDTRVCTGV